jgi:hypothetical protein
MGFVDERFGHHCIGKELVLRLEPWAERYVGL